MILFQGSSLIGDNIQTKTTVLSDIKKYFINPVEDNTIVYQVQSLIPVTRNPEGVLAFGISHIFSGDVNGEFFMTKGHFHKNPTRSEYYWGIEGKGLLLLMDRDRNCTIEEVYQGSLHFIEGYLAHRLVNISNTILSVGACWSIDSGYDYDTIAKYHFSKRVFKDSKTEYRIQSF